MVNPADDERDGPPPLDVHTRSIAADRETVWAALGRMLGPPRSSTALIARLVGAHPVRAAGDPLRAGSSLPGFAVTRADRPSVLVLEGNHRFSRYALTFRLRDAAGGTVVSAESRAAFPGVTGRLYRTLVVGSGGHVRAVRHMLATIERHARDEAGRASNS